MSRLHQTSEVTDERCVCSSRGVARASRTPASTSSPEPASTFVWVDDTLARRPKGERRLPPSPPPRPPPASLGPSHLTATARAGTSSWRVGTVGGPIASLLRLGVAHSALPSPAAGTFPRRGRPGGACATRASECTLSVRTSVAPLQAARGLQGDRPPSVLRSGKTPPEGPRGVSPQSCSYSQEASCPGWFSRWPGVLGRVS